MGVAIYNSEKQIKFDFVDTWLGSVEHHDKNSPFFVQELIDDKDWLYYQFLNNTRPVCDIINPIRLSSLDAVNQYSNRSLDFVFIDASHEYESVFETIKLVIPKMVKGGIICGDDYLSANIHRSDLHGGVERAVTELLPTHKHINNLWYFIN